MAPPRVRRRNDPAQYDDLAAAWWQPDGALAMLHWLAAARAELIPAPSRSAPVLLDVACGGGLLQPYAARAGYRHVGLDIGEVAARVARDHGVLAVRGDARRLPFADGSADVVVAGEALEHVPDLPAVVAELCRVLRPGGTVLLDTLARTRRARVLAGPVMERLPGGPPPGLHDYDLFVDRSRLVAEFARGGVPLTLRGLRLPVLGYVRWAAARQRGRPARPVRLRPSRSTAVLFQGLGSKGAT
jgi:2-polyprenyl-6-hydroxyphenyl methylase/3-demethylubiquinone-9 3-methyltransferase